jgi:hypothetical protein
MMLRMMAGGGVIQLDMTPTHGAILVFLTITKFYLWQRSITILAHLPEFDPSF